MAKRFHVTDEGKVLPCSATKRECRYFQRDENRHFDRKVDAVRASENFLRAKYGDMSSRKSSVRSTARRSAENVVRPRRGGLPYDSLSSVVSHPLRAGSYENVRKPLPSDRLQSFNDVLRENGVVLGLA